MSDLDIEWALSAARGNLVPSYEQRESIQRAVAQLQHRLESQQDLENTEVDDLPRQIAVFSSLLAHIRRLPPEILGTIMSDLDIEWALSAARENLVPSDEQRASIEQAVAQLQHHLESQEDFENTHDLRRQIAVFSSLLAPIRRLPPEILSQIWIQPSLDTPAPRSSYIRLPRFSGRGTNPVLAVSFHWRAIAVSTPKFWASFYVDLLGTDNTARLLELYLERSKQCLLSIRISGGGPVHPSILKQLIDSSERWVWIRLSSSHLSLFSPIRGRLQALVALDLIVYNGNAHQEKATWLGSTPESPEAQ
ncbi:hypothetical protein FB45DRAFT_74094 [Roridomyces roridus]|uniref:F-box domain-containing protein n=1 Tax=Roridomyces roridus TaxID=1738132 RepID=A0AAD7BNV5_9AGAR|nr:hypothetical protein FB45DRAFT_74094 [Roridomyces roridus]